MKIHRKGYAILGGTLLLIAAVVIYRSLPNNENSVDIRLSSIVLVGLGLTVVLMAILAIVYSVLGLENAQQALGLPEGSVRALLAFSLVLIFVCLGAFLFSEVNRQCSNCTKTMTMVNDAQLTELRKDFIVAAQLATDKNGKILYEQIPNPDKAGRQPATAASSTASSTSVESTSSSPSDDLKHPLYNVSYSPRPNAQAADFAKQIFTTLATIFVSVVSFYFGSSVTSSGVGAGARAAQFIGGDKRSAALQSSMADALVNSHAAQIAVDQATENLKNAQANLNADPADTQKQDAVAKAEAALDLAKKNLQEKQSAFQTAQGAATGAKDKGSAPAQGHANG
jgi:hypothetical protein